MSVQTTDASASKSFQKLYARASFCVGVLIAALACFKLSASNSGTIDILYDCLGLLWLAVSLGTFMIPRNQMPGLTLPRVMFIIFYVGTTFLMIAMRLSVVQDSGRPFLSGLREHPQPVYIGMLIFAGVYATINALVIRQQKKETAGKDKPNERQIAESDAQFKSRIEQQSQTFDLRREKILPDQAEG